MSVSLAGRLLLALLFEFEIAVDLYEELSRALDGHASRSLVLHDGSGGPHSLQLVLAQVIDVKIGQVGLHGEDGARLCDLPIDSIKVLVGLQHMQGAHYISGFVV